MWSGHGLAASVLEIQALGWGWFLQSLPGWWLVVSKSLVYAGEICVSCRAGCACMYRRGVPFVGRNRRQLVGEGGQEGEVFCFPSVCLVPEAGITVPRALWMHSQKNWWRAVKGDIPARSEVSGSGLPLRGFKQDPHHNRKVW